MAPKGSRGGPGTLQGWAGQGGHRAWEETVGTEPKPSVGAGMSAAEETAGILLLLPAVARKGTSKGTFGILPWPLL